MFENLGGGEIMLILVAILVLFGPKKIPELAQNLGKGLREFKKASQDLQQQLTKAVGEEDFNNIANSVKSIKQDMTDTAQRLGEHLQNTIERGNATQVPASLPAAQASEPLPAPAIAVIPAIAPEMLPPASEQIVNPASSVNTAQPPKPENEKS